MFSRIKFNIINTKLETRRLLLRPVTIRDLRKIFVMRIKQFVFNMMRTEVEMDYKSHLEWFKKRKNRVDYAIINKKNNKIIGIINTIFYFKNNSLHAELGKYLGDKKYHGKGLGSEATREWINFIFTSTKIKYFFAQTLKNNFSNIRLNKKLGFKILKNNNINIKKNEWVIMQITREEWLKKNPEILRNIYFCDLKKILKWRNSLQVREISLDSVYISYQKHLKWYKKIQTNKSYNSFVLALNNDIIGTVNLKEISFKNIRWSIYKKPLSKRGFGTFLAYHVLNKVFDDMKINSVLAIIYSINNQSIKFHESLGFKPKKKIINNEMSKYILTKNLWMKKRDLINRKLKNHYNF